MLTPTTENRIISFVRTVANDCASCLRRNSENCGNCRSLWANSIMRDVEKDNDGKSKQIDYSAAARFAKILLVLKTADRPVMSNEIDLEGTCSSQLKQWTLKQMIRKNVIGRRVSKRVNGHNYYFYFAKPKKEKHDETDNA